MSHQRVDQLASIQSMLVAGQRSVRIQRHSLLLWGVAGGVLCAETGSIITSERFPVPQDQAFALFAWLGFWIGAVGAFDYVLTRRVKRNSDETLPFAQAQITRAWWMLLGMGVLGSFAMFFYGGGAMIYALWIVLLGLGVYLFGLFSQTFIEWVGMATILLGIVGLATALPFGMTRWLAASVFALGLPLAGWLRSQFNDSHMVPRCIALGVWLIVVAGIPLFVVTPLVAPDTPAASVIPLAMFRPATGEQVVNIPAGTNVSFKVVLNSSLLALPPGHDLSLVLKHPMDIALRNGKPEGRYRIGAGEWASIRDGLLFLRIEQFSPLIENGKPVIRAHAVFNVRALQKASREYE